MSVTNTYRASFDFDHEAPDGADLDEKSLHDLVDEAALVRIEADLAWDVELLGSSNAGNATGLSLANMCKTFNENFADFYPDNHVVFREGKTGGLIVRIGEHDVQVDEDGSFVGRGARVEKHVGASSTGGR